MSPNLNTSFIWSYMAAVLLILQPTYCVGAAGNPIVAENRNTGSLGWKIGRSADDSGLQIKGYSSATSVAAGGEIDFHISVSPAQRYSIEIYRLGYYRGAGGRLLQIIGPLTGFEQPECPSDTATGMISCAWAVSYTLKIAEEWVTGIYLAKLINTEGFENYIPFVIHDDKRVPDLLFKSPVATYQAYNNFPEDRSRGKSSYDHNSYGPDTMKGTRAAVKLSFDRPYAGEGAGQVFLWEHNLLMFLEEQGYDVSYITDIDLHARPGRVLDVKGMISAGHDEYWSSRMYDAAETARDAGVDLAFFGAGAVYWQIRIEPSQSQVPNRVMAIYKDSTLDPEPERARKTDTFRITGRAEQRLVGVQYLDWNKFDEISNYIVHDSSHWIYQGTGFRNSDVVPRIIGYEVDARFADYPLPDTVEYTVLGRSPFTGRLHGDVAAETVIYETASGASVFASGTMSWSWALNKPGYIDQGIRRMTRNLLEHFVKSPKTLNAPKVENPGTQYSFSGDAVSLQVVAEHPQGDALSYTAAGLPAGLGIAAKSGRITGTVTERSAVSYISIIRVTDGRKTATVNLLWNVNQLPVPVSGTVPPVASARE